MTMLKHGDVYSGRESVNVIMSSPDNIAGNNHYPRARGNVVDYIKKCINGTISDINPGWAQKYDYEVLLSSGTTPGHYFYTVWRK